MGALSEALAERARAASADLRTGIEVTSIATDGLVAEVACADGSRYAARHVLANVAPRVLARLLGDDAPSDADTPDDDTPHHADTPHPAG